MQGGALAPPWNFDIIHSFIFNNSLQKVSINKKVYIDHKTCLSHLKAADKRQLTATVGDVPHVVLLVMSVGSDLITGIGYRFFSLF